MIYVFFNPLSNNKKGGAAENELSKIFGNDKIEFADITTISNIAERISLLKDDDTIIIAGGDGTLTRFADDVYKLKLKQKVFLYPCGSGNDFYNDVQETIQIENNLIPLNQYIESLPDVYVNGMQKKFVNGIGFGIDGYCCEEGDKMRETATDKPVNYTAIAIKGLLYKFHPCNAKVTVDGETKTYKRVWLAPTMLGRYYGGKMKVAPNQDRLNKEKVLTNVVVHKTGKLRTLMIFPKIIAGEHGAFPKSIDFRTGHEITVEFDKPQALQIDGETVRNVTTYTVKYK